MVLDQETKNFMMKTADIFNQNLVKQLNDNLIKLLNKNSEHTGKRFDDIEKRLETIESRLKIIHGHTEIIPQIFTLLEDDGNDIAKHTARINKLDS